MSIPSWLLMALVFFFLIFILKASTSLSDHVTLYFRWCWLYHLGRHFDWFIWRCRSADIANGLEGFPQWTSCDSMHEGEDEEGNYPNTCC